VLDTKLGAVIYLRSRRPLQLGEFGSDLRNRWPRIVLKSEGQQGNSRYLRVGNSRLAVEFRPTRVPELVTDEAIVSASARHWPTVAKDLKHHQAHLSIAASRDGVDGISLAADLTKVIAALESVSDSIGVAWLNGSIVNRGQDFVEIAKEMFAVGTLPLMLWIGALWDPIAHLMHTKGMSQFEAPELFLAQLPEPSTEMVEYLFELAYYVLTSGNELLDGETIDGPKGVLRVQSLAPVESGKRGLMLFPVQTN
jgi:hypothetical protein